VYDRRLNVRLGFAGRVLGEETVEDIGVLLEDFLVIFGAKTVRLAFVARATPH
jgi:hypothetical protein